jgi:hypothetical protein
VRPREAVGNWLYGVAYRTALEARGRIARRRARESVLVDVPYAEDRDNCWPELQAVLDRELHRLPDKYRLAVVLCDVEGRSRKEVARQLAIPEGTLSSRLAAARKKLSARLTRIGFTLSSVALAALLAENAASALVPPALVLSTTKAAVLFAAQQTLAAGVVSATVTALTEGVVKTMFLAKIKTTMMVLTGVTVLGLGTGGVLYQTRAGAADEVQPGRKQAGEAVAAKSTSALRAQEAAERDDKEPKRGVAQDPRARDRASREELEKYRQDAEAQRERAEAERRRAEEQIELLRKRLEAARQAEIEAKQKAEAILREATLRQTQRGSNKQSSSRSQQQATSDREDAEPSQKLRDEEHAKLRQDFEQRRKEMQEQLRKLREDYERSAQKLRRTLEDLDKQYRKQMADVETQRAESRSQRKASQPRPQQPPRQQGNPAASSGDKLDRILDRLDKLERRLQRLEQRKGPNEQEND